MSRLQPADRPGLYALCISIRCTGHYIPLTSTRLPENIFVFPAISAATSCSSRMRHIFASHSPTHVIVNHPLSHHAQHCNVLTHRRLMEDARDCAGAALKGHAVVGGLLSPVHASYRFKQKVRRHTNKPRTQLLQAKTSGGLKLLLGRWLMLPSASKWSFPPNFRKSFALRVFVADCFFSLLAVFSPAGDSQVRAACKSSSWLCADAWEFSQQEWSRSLLVLRRLGCTAFIIIVCASIVLQRSRKAGRDDERARS